MSVEEWLGDNQLSLDIWHKKYQNNEESFDNWVERISGSYSQLKNLIISKKFLFGGRILASRGIIGRKVTYSNCYVITPPEDNIESIFECASKLARTYSYGGGCGTDLSNLRPHGARVNNAAKSSDGPVSFMEFFSQVTHTICQGSRRGALMLSMDINHPDIEEFIDCKTDLSKVNFANISVKVNDAFMRAVENDDDYILRWPCDDQNEWDDKYHQDYCNTKDLEYNKLIPIVAVSSDIKNEPYCTKKIYYIKKVKARAIFNKLVKNNWDYAEPGILYWNRISEYNLLDNTNFQYAGVNPCRPMCTA